MNEEDLISKGWLKAPRDEWYDPVVKAMRTFDEAVALETERITCKHDETVDLGDDIICLFCAKPVDILNKPDILNHEQDYD